MDELNRMQHYSTQHLWLIRRDIFDDLATFTMSVVGIDNHIYLQVLVSKCSVSYPNCTLNAYVQSRALSHYVT